MKTLCDTCCVLLLIRIAPEMFSDQRYNCYTLREVKEEIFQTQRFRSRYPWRDRYKKEIKPTIIRSGMEKSAELYSNIINNKIECGTLNKKNGKLFNLSRTDQKIVSIASASKSVLATDDREIQDFVEQEFDGLCISSLGLLNQWLKEGVLEWSKKFCTIIEEWDRYDEAVQPLKDRRDFKELTKTDFMGP